MFKIDKKVLNFTKSVKQSENLQLGKNSGFHLYAGGNLSTIQVTTGQLADFNMWDYEMSADEVNVTTCGPAGNVASWDTLKKKGEPMESVKAFPGCNGKNV